MPRCLARWLLFGALASACQRVEPCSNDELRRGVEAVAELRDAHPLRIGAFDHEFRAGSRILAACPGLPVLHGLLDFDGVIHHSRDDAVRLHEVALRQTCLDLEAARDARAEVGGSIGAFYEPCDLGRFELIDPVRFRLSGIEGLIGVMAYDHMVRQGADPRLAAELADGMFWQSPWEFSDAMLSALPVIPHAHGFENGVAVRVTADAIETAGVWPHLAPSPEGPGRRLIIVADADVHVAVVSSIAAAAIEHGASAVSASVLGPEGDFGFVPLVAPQVSKYGVENELCVEAETVWSSRQLGSDGLPFSDEPATWRRIAAGEAAPADPFEDIERLSITPSSTLEELLVVVAGLNAAREVFVGDGVGEIDVIDGVNGCEAWFDVRESARKDAVALWDEQLRCESEPADDRRGRRVRAACWHELCDHAREHIVRFAAVPHIAERRRDAEAICTRATLFGSSTRGGPR